MILRKASNLLAKACESLAAQVLALVVCTAAWFKWPPTDVFNSFVSDASIFLMFVLLRSGAKDTCALQAKMDELIRATDKASNDLIGAEKEE